MDKLNCGWLIHRMPFKITYLIGADNHVNIPMEVHRDQEKIPYAAFAFYEEDCAHPFHSVNIPVRDLSELPTGSYVMIQIQKLYCFSLNCFLKNNCFRENSE